MPDVRLYIEGDSRPKAPPGGLKEAFEHFFKDLSESLDPNWKLEIVMGNGWPETFKFFCRALETHVDDLIILIVDSDAPVANPDLPWDHLAQQSEWMKRSHEYGWDLTNYSDNQCFLMIQATEAWLLADIDNIAFELGECFNLDKIRLTKGIESLSPKEMDIQLRAASRDCEEEYKFKKGNAYKYLLCVRPEVVSHAMPSCKRIFDVIPAEVKDR